jgi:FdrA protein
MNMIVKTLIQPNIYYDSLVLMRVSNQLLILPDVTTATVMMGTEQNKHSIGSPELLTEEVKSAGPNDLFIVIAATTESSAQAALEHAAEALVTQGPAADEDTDIPAQTLEGALRQKPAANLVVLSIPGKYVKREAMRALNSGLHVLIFSDNVPLEDEIELKKFGRDHNLLVMGPDCGTAIVNGAALAFANGVRQGRIGLVGASGTGLQEVSCLIDHLGEGVSQAIGTGSRDVSEDVGAITLIQGLQMLEEDLGTEVIVIVSKPPAPSVAIKVMQAIQNFSKPVVINFLDGDPEVAKDTGKYFARTLEDAAVKAITLLTGKKEEDVYSELSDQAGDLDTLALEARVGLADTQRYIRGLFSGGTFSNEASMILREQLGTVFTNGKIKGTSMLSDPLVSLEHTCVDMGDDIFTVGKPHPMLEPSMRQQRLLSEAADPEVAVILLDIVLGFGVHPDPAGEFVDFITRARQMAETSGRKLPVVASICGVDADPQNRSEQVNMLESAGVLVMPSNAQAAKLAAKIISK